MTFSVSRVFNGIAHSYNMQHPMEGERLFALCAPAPQIEPIKHIGLYGDTHGTKEILYPPSRAMERTIFPDDIQYFELYNTSAFANHADEHRLIKIAQSHCKANLVVV